MKATLPMFSIVGSDDPILVVINGKLTKADKIVMPKINFAGTGDNIPLGEMIVISADLVDQVPEYVKQTTYKWEVTDDQGQPKQFFANDSTCYFGAGIKSTTIHVNVLVGLTYDLNGQIVSKVVMGSKDVTVGDPKPNPNPGPGPNPGPSPAPNISGIEKLVFDWANDPSVVVAGVRDMVVKGCKALSKSFKQMSKDAGTGTFADLRSILVESKNRNNAALNAAGVDPQMFKMWGEKLQDKLFTMYEANQISTIPQIKKVWWSIAAGLFLVK